jgi:hypothetical protein
MSLMATVTPESSGTARVAPWRRPREARLRVEYGELYPGLRAGEWEAAAVLADRVLADRLLRGSETALEGRVLLEAHFDFRGGASRGGERDGVRRTTGPGA